MKKLEIIKKSFRMLKLKGASSDPSVPQYPDALIDLESLMAELGARPSVNTGYNSTGSDATLDEESGLVLSDINAISAMLAINIGVDYGIEAAPPVHNQARAGLSDLMKRGAVIPRVKYTSRMPRGLGNTNRNRNIDNYYRDQPVLSGANKFKVNSFINWTVDFTSWLLGDSLTSVTWVAQNGKIKIENESLTTDTATAKLTFNNVGVYTVEVTGTSANGQTVESFDFSISDKLEN